MRRQEPVHTEKSERKSRCIASCKAAVLEHDSRWESGGLKHWKHSNSRFELWNRVRFAAGKNCRPMLFCRVDGVLCWFGLCWLGCLVLLASFRSLTGRFDFCLLCGLLVSSCRSAKRKGCASGCWLCRRSCRCNSARVGGGRRRAGRLEELLLGLCRCTSIRSAQVILGGIGLS